MRLLDRDPAVLRWCSEEIVVPYLSPKDGKMHRYFPDFAVEKKMPDGKIQKFMVEVKPNVQCKPPKTEGRRKTKRLMEEMKTYDVNQAKWAAATEYCRRRGWTFVVLDEYALRIKKRPQ